MDSDNLWGVVGLCVIVWLVTWLFTEPGIQPQTIAYAEVKCKANGGWKYVEEGHNRFATVYCADGAEFNYNPMDLEKDEHL